MTSLHPSLLLRIMFKMDKILQQNNDKNLNKFLSLLSYSSDLDNIIYVNYFTIMLIHFTFSPPMKRNERIDSLVSLCSNFALSNAKRCRVLQGQIQRYVETLIFLAVLTLLPYSYQRRQPLPLSRQTYSRLKIVRYL